MDTETEESMDVDQTANRTFYHYFLDRSEQVVRNMPAIDPTVDMYGVYYLLAYGGETGLSFAPPSHPRKYVDPGLHSHVTNELDRLSELSENWDGYGAPAIDPGIIDAARTLVPHLPIDLSQRPHVVPLTSGGLQLEWTFGDVALELEFESPVSIRYLKWDPAAGDPEENTIPATDHDGIRALIRWYGR